MGLENELGREVDGGFLDELLEGFKRCGYWAGEIKIGRKEDVGEIKQKSNLCYFLFYSRECLSLKSPLIWKFHLRL